ncbi:MAG: hypothetical protein GXY48_09155 [Methanomicrobiales archaeon]|nr:hypothetical protein [Methanomicrobiales archaeon]
MSDITEITFFFINHTLARTKSLQEAADYGTGEQITEEISLDVLKGSKQFIQICENLISPEIFH